jgi:hypothetical protein
MDPVYLKDLIINRPSEIWYWYEGLKERNELEVEANYTEEERKKLKEKTRWEEYPQKQLYKKIQKERQKLWQDLTTE